MSIEKQLSDSLISVFQTSPEYSRLPPATKAVLNDVIRTSSVPFAQKLYNDVSSESNKQLDLIPNNLIGVNNPVDIVNGNITNQELTNTLAPTIETKFTDDFSSLLSNTIFNNFKNKVPPAALQAINLLNLTGILNTSSKSGVEKGIQASLNAFAGGLFSNSPGIPPIINNVESLFGSDPIGGLTRVNQAYDSSISNQALSEAKTFNISKPDNEEKLITQTVGFIDPTAEYPTKEYKGRSEANKLATGDVNGTIVQQKEIQRVKGIQLPNNERWEQPAVSYNAEYPYNKVLQTESGHIIEMDDTPGAERLQVYHRSGTFIEIDPNGSVIKRTKGSSYEIIDRNGHIAVSGDAHLSVSGGIKIFVGGNADIEVEGDTNIKCLNDITAQAAGKMNLSATEEINITSANINLQAYHTCNVKSDVSLNMFAETDLNLKSNTNAYIEAPQFFNRSTNYYNQVLTNLYEKIGTSRFSELGSQVHFKSGGSFNVDGSRVDLNSGTALGSLDSRPALKAGPSKIGVIGERKDIKIQKIPNATTASFLDVEGYKAEDSEFAEEADKQRQVLTQTGIASNSNFEESAVEINRDTPRSSTTTIVMPSDKLLGQKFLPENYQLSKHFTLAMLSSKAVVTKNPVTSQLGLSYGELVYNLQAMALNICEPVLALYPNMFVTSAFRIVRNSGSTSDHPRGKAVDIQFKNVPKSEYFNIAKRLANQLNYDKILLEYKTYGTGLPWIHISFDIEKQRKIVLTYLNDKKYGDGLISLA